MEDFMKIETKNIVASKYEVNVVMEGTEWTTEVDKAFNKLAKNVSVPGFRNGKAPKEMIKKHLSQQKVYSEAIDSAMQIAYQKALEESKLQPIIRPSVEVKDFAEDHFEVTFVVTIAPTVTLGQYKDITVQKEEVSVSEEELSRALKNVQERNAELTMVTDRAVEKNDIVNIDFTGYVDGKEFEGGKAKGYSLTIGSNTFIAGFEDQIIGMRTGEEKDIFVVFPENYVPDLAGKNATFKIKLNDIRVKVLPELDDSLALDADIENVSTLEELKNHLTADIKKSKQQQQDSKQFQDLLNKIVEGATVEVADTLVNAQIDYKVDGLKKQIEQNGITFDQYLKMTNSNEEKLRESLVNDATKSVKTTFVVEEIIKVENLNVTGEEVEAEVTKLANQYNIPVDEFKGKVKDQLDYLYYNLRDKKLYDFLKTNNNF
ncbi:MAG: trigger factor [Erysipelotrichaceae bacterium]|nr:trigger factor [Erysipelotrichaceae bacterium]